MWKCGEVTLFATITNPPEDNGAKIERRHVFYCSVEAVSQKKIPGTPGQKTKYPGLGLFGP